LSEAAKVAEKLKTIIENHKFEKINKLTCSFGVTEFKEKDMTDSLFTRVDSFMYEAVS